MKIDLIIDYERAMLVITRVNNAFLSRIGLLSETEDLVENQIPEGVNSMSVEHAQFLFFIVANDHGMKSSRLYSKAKQLFAESRELFSPHYVVEKYRSGEDPELINNTGIYLGSRYPRETAKSWYQNSKRLVDQYNGSPLDLLKSTSDAKTLLNRIKEFRGFGPKIGGMLLRAAIGLGFSKVYGIDEVLVPVDIHDSRISFLTGIVRTAELLSKPDYQAFTKQIQKILLITCNSLNLEWLNADRALWLIGSRGCVNKRCTLCPLSDLCEVGREYASRIQSGADSGKARGKRRVSNTSVDQYTIDLTTGSEK